MRSRKKAVRMFVCTLALFRDRPALHPGARATRMSDSYPSMML
jgi:hypothetical protein